MARGLEGAEEEGVGWGQLTPRVFSTNTALREVPWRRLTQEDNAPSRAQIIKQTSQYQVWNTFLKLVRVVPKILKTTEAMAAAFGCPAELGDKTLLLEVSRIVGYRRNQAEPDLDASSPLPSIDSAGRGKAGCQGEKSPLAIVLPGCELSQLANSPGRQAQRRN